METAALKSFASIARTLLLREVSARLSVVLSEGSTARVEAAGAVASLTRAVSEAGGGEVGRAAVVDRAAYTWFNRVIALRFMDASGFTSVGVVSPVSGRTSGQPAVLADAKAGHIDADVVPVATAARIAALLGGQLTSSDPQGEAYGLMLLAYCRHWNKAMPFMFEADADYSELLMPSDLLAEDSVVGRAVTAMSPEVCQDVEVIGWLYQFYIAERKDEVFAGFKKNKKAGPAEIPAATQLFTPHWIVRYLVENSLGRLWLLNHPTSGLRDQLEYYIAPVDEATGFLEVTSPEELKLIDPACGSGHMLTYAFDLLYAIYEEEGYTPAEIPGLILKNNLYGTEIDPRAGSLAAFALTMKARQRQRTFFAKAVQPNICVLEPIRFTAEEFDGLVAPGGDRADEELFLNHFEHADTLGALIRPNQDLIEPIKTHLLSNPPTDLLVRDAHARAERVIVQATYLSQRYHVVVANPPYLGTKALDARFGTWAKREYQNSKSDLFAMFIERNLGLVVPAGIVAMITMQSWMFLSAYESLREQILRKHTILSLAHLGTRSFDSVGGEVVSTTAFVLDSQHRPDLRGTYLRLTEGRSEVEKEALYKGAIRKVELASELETADITPKPMGPFVGDELAFQVSASGFTKVPGSPIVYWFSDRSREVFEAEPLSGVATFRAGLQTGDNDTFLRFWHEIPANRFAPNCQTRDEAVLSGSKWFPHNKGGGYRKWYGLNEYVINWEGDGREIKERKNADLRAGRITANNSKCWNQEFYFENGLTWSSLSSSNFSLRDNGHGFLFDTKGQMLFPKSETDREQLLGFLNSKVAHYLLNALSPTLDFNGGVVSKLPVSKTSKAVTELTDRLVRLARDDWDSYETSWNFLGTPLLCVPVRQADLKTAYYLLRAKWDAAARDTQVVEQEINRIFIDGYGMQEELTPTVELCDVTLTSNPHYRYARNKTESEREALIENDTVRDLLSYAAGCMFGRFSLDQPGLILASSGESLHDFLERVPKPSFGPDGDNVIPITDGEWFEDDIVSRFRQFLRVSFGDEHFDENLRFIEESLGKDIRSYFLKDFYKDHVQRYKKRPIYWLFASPKGSFNALIYMHRYTPSTVSTVLNEYLREFQAKLTAELASKERDAVAAADPKARNAAAKEVDRLRKVLVELNEYEHDVLYPLASRQISIDLDDGVKANYPKFGTALKKIVGLESAGE